MTQQVAIHQAVFVTASDLPLLEAWDALCAEHSVCKALVLPLEAMDLPKLAHFEWICDYLPNYAPKKEDPYTCAWQLPHIMPQNPRPIYWLTPNAEARFLRAACLEAIADDAFLVGISSDGHIFTAHLPIAFEVALFSEEAKEIDRAVEIMARNTQLSHHAATIQEQAFVQRKLEKVVRFGHWKFDLLSGQLHWSDGILNLLGLDLPNEQLDYAHYLSLLHPDDRPMVEGLVKQSSETGMPYQAKARHRQPDGTYKYLLSRAKVMMKQGRPRYMIGIALDIDADMQTASTLNTAKKQLEAVVGATDETLILVERTAGTYTIASVWAYKDLFPNHTAQTIIGKQFHEIMSEKQANYFQQNIQYAMDAPDGKGGLHYKMHIEGKERFFQAFIYKIPGIEEAVLRVKDATEEAEVQRQLNELVKLHGSVLFALNQSAIVAITDVRGVITYCNDKFTEISGYSKRELIGQSHRMLKSGRHDEAFYRGLWRTIARGNVWRGDICNKRKDGSLYWVDTTIVPVLNHNRQPDSYISIRYEITEKLAAIAQLEQMLVQNQELLASIQAQHSRLQAQYETTSFQIQEIRALNSVLARREGILSQVGRIARVGGWEMDVLTGKFHWSEEIHYLLKVNNMRHVSLSDAAALFLDEDRLRLLKAFANLTEKGRPFDLTLRIYANERLFWVRLVGMLEESDGIKKAYGVLQDMTQAKQIEQELIESRAQYKLLVENAVDVVALYNGRLECEYVSPSIERFMGYTVQEFMEGIATSEENFDPEDGHVIQQVIDDTANKIPSATYQYRQRHKNGQYFWVELAVRRNFKPNGSLDKVFVVYNNIDARKKAELALIATKKELEKTLLHEKQMRLELGETLEALQKAQVQLIQSEKMASLGQLTAGIAHEINNPINFVYAGVAVLKENIQLMVEMLQAAYSTPPDHHAMELLAREHPINESISMMNSIVRAIDEGAIRTRDIVIGLRSFARTDVMHRYAYHIKEGLESTLLLLKSQMKSVKVDVHYDSDLPQIMGYPSQLNQVFMNLLVNAVQASDGHATINIAIERIDGNNIRISIADNGKGIPKAYLSRIFDPFFTTKPPGEGTGLGLAIVHGIIEKHHGQISVESEEGKGTTFTIILPGMP